MIKARIPAANPEAHTRSYEETYRAFSWSNVEKEFTWYETGRVNIVHEAIDRWVDGGGKADQPALVFEKGGETVVHSYADLKRISCQWANLFAQYGFGRGDRMFFLLPPCPQTYFAMLACARMGVIFSPLYESHNYDELKDRLVNAEPKGILTHPDLAERLPSEVMGNVKFLFLTQGPLPGVSGGEVLIETLPEKMPERYDTRWLNLDTSLYLLYTSGSTGPPKGIVHAHGDMVGHLATARSVLDLRGDSVVWTDGDPAWVTGTVYGAFAPWLAGATSVVQGDPFSASTWYRTLEKHNVSVWYTTPRTVRRLMEAGEDLPHRYDFGSLAHVATVGETLSPECFYWVRKNLALSPHDSWWMTETGMVCIANFPFMDIKPGSMGKPVPGVSAAVVDEKGEPLPMFTIGELALRPGWPSMLKAIWRDEARFEEYFRLEGWFLTGDMVIEDEDGYIYHQGRTDDLIKAGEKLIGPYEIEQALFNHPAVNEAAVIAKEVQPGRPVLKAFVTAAKGFQTSNRLIRELKAFVRANVSPEASLTEIEFLDELPKTRSGKLLRRVLRARELGLPGGDAFNMQD